MLQKKGNLDEWQRNSVTLFEYSLIGTIRSHGVSVNISDRWQALSVLSDTDHKGTTGSLDHIFSNNGQLVEAHDAFDLDKKTMQQSEITPGQPHDRSDRLSVGKISTVE